MAKTTKEVLSIQEKLKQELAGLKERVDPPTGFTISTKGKTFTLPDGSQNDGPMSCIILDWVTANIYFAGIYNPNDIKPPVCFSISTIPAAMVPSKKSPKKQHANCKECPKNEYGSGTGKGKACKNSRRLLIVPANADENTQLWIINVSPTGLKHYDKYVNSLADIGKHPIEIITEISFDASEAYPSLRFKGQAAHDNLSVLWALKEQGQPILYQEPNVEDKAA